MTSAPLRSSLVSASHAALAAAAAEEDVSHIAPRQSAGIASTPGHSAPKKDRHGPLAGADCQPRRDGCLPRAGLRRLPAVPDRGGAGRAEIRNMASDPAPADSDRIREMAERITNATDMLLIRWTYIGERTE
ncbi:hypothetical protein DL767_005487 [Monosporascus sp. MG133]|nr:hypothetical protein DL767_005487 [Monosporascus sp. MG133]